jgi:hypothetical protein
VRGVRLGARDLERARTQWEGLLGARAERDGERVVFSWSDSPLYVAVELDATGEDGPRALEVSAPARDGRALAAYVDPVTRVRIEVRD